MTTDRTRFELTPCPDCGGRLFDYGGPDDSEPIGCESCPRTYRRQDARRREAELQPCDHGWTYDDKPGHPHWRGDHSTCGGSEATLEPSDAPCPTAADGHRPTYWRGACVVCDSLAAIIAAQDAARYQAQAKEAEAHLRAVVHHISALSHEYGSGIEFWNGLCHEERADRDGVWNADYWKAVSHVS